VGVFLKALQGTSQLTSLNLTISDCGQLDYDVFQEISKTLATLTNLKVLTLGLEGFEDLDDEAAMRSFSKAIGSLKNLTKLHMSFARNISLLPRTIKPVFDNILLQLTSLHELTLDLSDCRSLTGLSMTNLASTASKLPLLTKCALLMHRIPLQTSGVHAVISIICKAEKLVSLTLDCRQCGRGFAQFDKKSTMGLLNKMTKLTEKVLICDEQREATGEEEEERLSGSNEDNNGNIQQNVYPTIFLGAASRNFGRAYWDRLPRRGVSWSDLRESY